MNNNSFFRICDASIPDDVLAWLTAWQSWPMHEVYAHPHYVKLYTDGVQSHAFCALWESDEGCVLYPFILRDLTSESYWTDDLPPLFDMISPYGYGGPFCWDVKDHNWLQAEFWETFNQWALKKCIVSEFVRFSLFNETLLPYPGNLEMKLKNVVRSLDMDESALWMDFKHKVRKNVNRARANHVKVETDVTADNLDDFLRIYNQTLERRTAKSVYYFSRAYFESLTNSLFGQFIYFHARLNGKLISTELVLISQENVFSFLGGTDENYFDIRPNDLLKYEIIRWAKIHSKKRFVLGGGYADDDGIFQYKASFAPNGVMPFSVGTRVLNQSFYDRLLTNKKLSSKEWVPLLGYFPAYRA